MLLRAIGGQENKVKTYIENEVARLGLDDYVESGVSTYRKGYSNT